MDLTDCQRRLLHTVASSYDNAELIPPFEIALEDRFMVSQLLVSYSLISAVLLGIYYADSFGVLPCRSLNTQPHIHLVRS
jgi:hypothetical protein